jgi:hypothetical protein
MDSPVGMNVGLGVPVGGVPVFQNVAMSVEGVMSAQGGVSLFQNGIPIGVESMNMNVGIPVSVGVGGMSMESMGVGGVGIPVGAVGVNVIDPSLVAQQMKEAPPPPPAP